MADAEIRISPEELSGILTGKIGLMWPPAISIKKFYVEDDDFVVQVADSAGEDLHAVEKRWLTRADNRKVIAVLVERCRRVE